LAFHDGSRISLIVPGSGIFDGLSTLTISPLFNRLHTLPSVLLVIKSNCIHALGALGLILHVQHTQETTTETKPKGIRNFLFRKNKRCIFNVSLSMQLGSLQNHQKLTENTRINLRLHFLKTFNWATIGVEALRDGITNREHR